MTIDPVAAVDIPQCECEAVYDPNMPHSAETIRTELIDSYPSIRAARMLAERRINSARERLRDQSVEGLDIVAFGSLARGEVTIASDFDYLVIATVMPESSHTAIRLLNEADHLRASWQVEEGRSTAPSPPGSSGLFGDAVGAFDLVQKIGLQDDSNHSLTRRMLLLEESVSLLNEEVHSSVVRAILRRYLEVGRSKPEKVPRFLLNDVTRYWHTITVDYQAKARLGPASSGLRYVKLLIPRKLVFPGTAMSLLLSGLDGYHQSTVDELKHQFALSPVERLVQGYSSAPDPVRTAMEGALGVIDRYLKLSSEEQWRHRVKRSSKDSSSPSTEFTSICGEADRLQEYLEVIFFEWDLIADRTRRTLVF